MTRWGRIDEQRSGWVSRFFHIVGENGSALCDPNIVNFARIYDTEHEATPTQVRSRLCSACATAAALNLAGLTRRSVSQLTTTGSISNRTFGIEIECVGPVSPSDVALALRTAGVDCYEEHYNHNVRGNWKIVPDGSVHGTSPSQRHAMEIVSPPLMGEAGLLQVETVCSVLNRLNVTVNRTCGLHVHHDGRNLTPEALLRIVRFYAAFEHVFDSFQPPTRRNDNNTYCRSLRGYIANLSNVRTMLDIQRTFVNRYVKVNLSAILRHNTVEFRHHAGSVNAAKIVAWIQLTNALVEFATTTTELPVAVGNIRSDAAHMLETLNASETTSRFYSNRQNVLA